MRVIPREFARDGDFEHLAVELGTNLDEVCVVTKSHATFEMGALGGSGSSGRASIGRTGGGAAAWRGRGPFVGNEVQNPAPLGCKGDVFSSKARQLGVESVLRSESFDF